GGIFPALAKDDRAVRPCLHRRASDAVPPGIPAGREKVVRIRPMKYVAAAALAAATVLLLAHAGWADSKEGQRRWTRVVKKQSLVVYKVVFVAEAKAPNKKCAEFAVIGDGSTDIDIYVLDADGKEVASDTSPSDLAHVRWVPDKTQEYTIKVRNLGNQDNTCTMGHN